MKDGMEEYFDKLEQIVGTEKTEEVTEDSKFLVETFSIQLTGGIMAFALMMSVSITDYEIENAVRAMMISSMEFYRDWLSQKGIDVRKLEGRND